MKKLLLLAIAIVLFGIYWSQRENASVTIPQPPRLSSLDFTRDKSGQAIREEISISISPGTIIQGDPAQITINGLSSTQAIKSLSFDGKPVPVFLYEGKSTALVGIDLRGRTGSYKLVLTLEDGQKVEGELVVGERAVAKAPLSIPEKLGGDTPEAEKELIKTLAEEASLISAVTTSDQKLWGNRFRFPLAGEVFITDTYGYTRLTGASTISHKGTDFRATVGTPVYAMNSGLVRLTKQLRNYGKTIIIDHGLGLFTIYMHLSEMNVKVDDLVQKGDFIGKSGETGYVLGPHLHITVRIGGTSIDPMKFMELLGHEQ